MNRIRQDLIYTIKDSKLMSKLFNPLMNMMRRRLEKEVVAHPLRRFDRQHRIYYGKPLDLNNPRTMYEKICFLEFCCDTSLQTRCTDKVAVRDYIEEQGLGSYLNKVYRIFDSLPTVEELNAAMPEKCVVKTSHSGGGEAVFVVNPKLPDTTAKIHSSLAKALADDYGRRTGQPHYIGIKPQIIIEQLIENDKDTDLSPNDYKLFCLNGEPVFFNAIGDRNLKTHHMLDEFFSLDWTPLGKETVNNPVKVPAPKTLHKMIEIARILAKPFPFVRVDFYESQGKIIFGELTFTPGFDNFIGRYGEQELRLGDKMDISGAIQVREVDPAWY